MGYIGDCASEDWLASRAPDDLSWSRFTTVDYLNRIHDTICLSKSGLFASIYLHRVLPGIFVVQ